MDRKKIFNIKSIKKVLKRKNKTVLCHGVFDVLHYGHLKYFEAAKKYGNFLIVSVTQDKYVDKGHGRPFFNDKIRFNLLFSLLYIHKSIISKKTEDLIKSIKYFNNINTKNKISYNENLTYFENLDLFRNQLIDFMMIWFYSRTITTRKELNKHIQWKDKKRYY